MITLRPFQLSDSTALQHILNQPEVVQYLSSKINNPYTEQDALWWITTGSKQGIVQAITLEQQMIGCIGIIPGEFEYQRNGELGYWLDPQYWGQGIMAQAITMLIDQVFATTDITRIFAVVFSANKQSNKVLLKTGFNHEACLKQAIYKNQCYYDKHIFSQLKPDITTT